MSMRSLRCLALLLCAGATYIAAENSENTERPVKAPVGSARAKIPSQVLPHVIARGDRIPSRLRSTSARTGAVDRVAMAVDCIVTDDVLAAIRACGAVITGIHPRWNSVLIEATFAEVDAIAAMPAVRGLSLSKRPHLHQQGTADNAADIDMKAAQLRSTYGATGAGRKIGVISDSIHDTAAVGTGVVTGAVPNATLSGTIPQNNGNLPASITVIDFGTGGGTDEGEGMLELVHDVAPGSTLLFSSAGDTELAFAANIGKLASAGCHLIVDDVYFFEEPYFQDGPIAQAVDAAHQGGALYFSAAGNEGDDGIMMPFSDTNAVADPHTTTLPTGADYHDWGIGGATPTYLPITVPNGRSVTIYLQWNEPFARNGLGSGSRADLDLFLFSAPSTSAATYLTSNEDAQGTAAAPFGNPVEGIEYTNSSGAAKTVYLVVDRYTGISPSVMRLVFFGSFTAPNHATVFTKTTMFGHACATNAVAVGAIFYADIGQPTIDGDPTATNAESYSAKGGLGVNGIPIYFSTSGALLASAPQRRNKPDIAAPDGTNTSVFGSDGSFDADAFPNFFGTSAAAPNAAAAAALVWSLAPTLTNAQILTQLKATAVDIVANAPVSGVGADDRTGAGLVDAYAAALATTPAARVINVTSPQTNGTYAGGSITINVTFDHNVTVTGSPRLQLTSGLATYTSGSGTSTLVFTYAISFGDNSPDLDYASTGALTLNGGTINDPAGAANRTLPSIGAAGSLATNKNLVIAATSPALTITANRAFSNGGIVFTYAFARDVTGFTAGDITVGNAAAGAFTGSGSTYTLAVTPIAEGTVSTSVAASAASDIYAYPSAAGSGSATYDVTSPTVTITPSAAAVTTGSSFSAVFQFSEAVAGFSAAGVGASGASVGSVSGSGSTYTVVFTAGPDGTAVITALAGSITDLAGNAVATPASANVTVSTPPDSGGSGSGSGCGLGGIGVLLAALLLVHARTSAQRTIQDDTRQP